MSYKIIEISYYMKFGFNGVTEFLAKMNEKAYKHYWFKKKTYFSVQLFQ